MAALTVTVNGQRRVLDVADDVPLLWVLRDHLKLRGTKFGCGRGFCGACTVLINGVAVRSCMTPVGSVGARPVITIEGLGSERLHPVQAAWIEHDVPQCGYCQAGQIMTAVSLLSVNPHPTDEQIRDTMSANLCRCGTYHRIRRAVAHAASLLEQSR